MNDTSPNSPIVDNRKARQPHRFFSDYWSSGYPVKTKTGRRILLGPDLLRFLSVIAIVWIHGHGPGQKYLEISIYSLVLLSVTLPTMGTSSRSFNEFVSHRAKRLLIPYAFFWLFYSIFTVLTGKSFIPSPWILIEGHGPHLWYLPYAFFASVIVYQLNTFLSKIPASTVNVFLLGLSMTVFIGIELLLDHDTWSSRIPRLYLTFAPSIPLGLFIGRLIREKACKTSIYWLIILIITTGVVTEVLQSFGLVDLTLRYCTALALVISALLWQQGTSSALLKLTGLSMAIYLLHPAVYFLLERGITGINNFSPLFAIVMILITIPVAWMAQHSPLRRLL